MFHAVRRGLEVRFWRHPQRVRASVFKSVISDVVLLFGIAVIAFFFVGFLLQLGTKGECDFLSDQVAMQYIVQ